MKNRFAVFLAGGACLGLLVSCATREGMEDIERTGSQSQKILRENEMRLHNLENSVTALNTQIEELNNRVFEVRTKNGQRTSMKVVPVAATSSAAPNPLASPQAKSAAHPAGKRINPAAKPSPLPAAAQRKPVAAAARTAENAAPVSAQASGSLGAQESNPSQLVIPQSSEIAMPPTELETPVSPAQTYSGSTISAHADPGIANSNETVVPVPLIPASDLSLPPETPGLPEAVGQTGAVAVPAPAAATQSPRQTAARPAAGEEAAYQAALRAARSGNTNEGIRLFRDFLQKYPSGRYTANADYWLGECLYAQGKYQDALNQFQTVNNSYPSHHKNADALLKAGLTMSKMGNKDGAQQKFRQVLASFPNSDAAKRVRAMGIK